MALTVGEKVLQKRLKNRRLPNYHIPIIEGNDELARALQDIQEHLRMYEGDNSAPKQRFVTIEELEDSGIITAQLKNNFAFIAEVQGEPVKPPAGTFQGSVRAGSSRATGSSGANVLDDLGDVSGTAFAGDAFLKYTGTSFKQFLLFSESNTWAGDNYYTKPIQFQEMADSPSAVAERGYIWVRDDSPNVLIFTDDAGTDFVIAGAGGSSPTITGTPVDNQIAVWDSATSLEGDANFIWDGTNFQIINTATFQITHGGTDVTISNDGAGGDMIIDTPQQVRLQIGGTDKFVVENGNGHFLFHDWPVLIEERAAAGIDIAGYGQLWIRNDVPNTLMFTDDAGTDYPVSGSGVAGGNIANGSTDDATARWDTGNAQWEEITQIRASDAGVFTIYDSGETDSAAFSHDGTDFNTAFTGTTDWNLTGLTVIRPNNAYFQALKWAAATTADVDAITADSNGNEGVYGWTSPAATGAPNSQTFMGMITVDDGSRMNQLAFGYGTLTGEDASLYVRRDTSGAWTSWMKAIMTDIDDQVARMNGSLRIRDAADTDYIDMSHDGTDAVFSYQNTTAHVFNDVDLEVHEGGAAGFIVSTDNNRVDIRDGWTLKLRNPADTLDCDISHTGTALQFQMSDSGDFFDFSIPGTDTRLYLLHSSTDVAWVRAAATQVELRSLIHGATVRLIGEDTGGTARTLLVADPDAGMDFYEYTGGSGVIEMSLQQSAGSGNTSGLLVRDHGNTLRDAGFNTLNTFNFNASDTLEAQHCGSATGKDNTTSYTLTGPVSGDTDFPVGGVCTIMNLGSSTDYNLADTASCTMYVLDGSSVTDIAGAATIAPGGIVTLYRYSASAIYLWGSGLTA